VPVRDEAVAARTVAEAVRAGAAELDEACDTPRLDAELLMAHALGTDRSRLVTDGRAVVDDDALVRFRALISRRQAREPVAYIVGFKEFRRISLAVDRRVLIPRPETELLVEVGLSLAGGARVADVGTGSGAVALALKAERPDVLAVGIDVSADAVAVARANAARLELDVRFVVADLLDGETYDAVLASLPYVADGAELAPEIDVYEPTAALFGGPDGLDVIRRLVASAGEVEVLALEVGFDQAAAVAALLAEAGFESAQRLRDLAGHERVVVGRR
jgi:release factor glutamine methyltransferase